VKPEDSRPERSGFPAPGDVVAHPALVGLWEQFLARENLTLALRRVERNAGAAGIDGMSTKELRPWLHEHWLGVRSELDAGTYRPRPVRRVTIPKPSGGERMLGVPTVVDRLICQALTQVLMPVFDPYFHPHSFGFRPGRSAHQAVERARQFIADDAAWCVDLDLDSFFDRVQHDVLMARVARRVHDGQVLKLVRAYLEAGVMADGIVHVVGEGTPQGSPLSPLLSNVILDDLDWELDRRGHRFRALRGRQHDLCRLRACGAARHAGHRGFHRAAPEVACQCREVGARPGTETDLSRVPFLSLPGRASQDRCRTRSSKEGQGAITEIDCAQLGCLDAVADRTDQPLHGWVDGVFLYRRFHQDVRETRCVVTPQAAADSLEGMEAPQNALPEPTGSGCPRARRPQVGTLTQGALAYITGNATPHSTAQQLLAQHHRPEGTHRNSPPSPGTLSEPPGADPHARWCGRGRGKPGPYPISRAVQSLLERLRCCPLLAVAFEEAPSRVPSRAGAGAECRGPAEGSRRAPFCRGSVV
jgi:retron-type reverse transcriptase